MFKPPSTVAAFVTSVVFGGLFAPESFAASATSWSGPYIGAFIGYDDANNAWTPDSASGGPSLSPQGVLGGGLAGANFQFDRFVVGVEADLMFADFAAAEPCDATGADCSLDGRLMGSLRARGGLVLGPRMMIYATGGPAFSFVKASSTAFGGMSDSQTLGGWTEGIGVEFAVADSVWVGVEYRHSDYGASNFDLSPGVNTGIDFQTNEATLRLTVPLD